MSIDSVNECMQWERMYTYTEEAYMNCYLQIQFFFFDWANMIACNHANISLVSHSKQKLQKQTQVKVTLL